MVPILSLLVVVSLSILMTRVGSIALIHTGLSRESARFQARSAFTGAGFTTAESEQVVGHPVRRRIILLLMLLGNAGFVTAISSLILTFVDVRETSSAALRLALLAGGLATLWALSSSRWVDRRLSHLIDRALRRFTRLDVRDYASLMHLAGDYRLVEMVVEETDWIADRALGEVRLRDEGIIVLGIKRASGQYVGVPDGETCVVAGDTLLLYGRAEAIERLDRRYRNMTADARHQQAVDEQLLVRDAEARADTVPRREGNDQAGGAGGDAPRG